jgi:hypothetical protein
LEPFQCCANSRSDGIVVGAVVIILNGSGKILAVESKIKIGPKTILSAIRLTWTTLSWKKKKWIISW